MSAQVWLVALIVIGCFAYAAWSLMPVVVRRGLIAWALRLPWPARVSAYLQNRAAAGPGCGGCNNCNSQPVGHAGTSPRPITIHPRPPH